ncbi:MAG: amidohydrolase family protein [Myxococcota bacterium]|nr:amidohydrolase family protein [Myxococcota bacterium]
MAAPSGIPLIDFHTHVDPRYPDVFLSRFDEAGIAVAVNMSGGSPGAINFSVRAQKDTGGRLLFFCVIPWGYSAAPDFVPAVVEFLGACGRAGGLGVKISKGLGLGAIDPSTGGLLAVDDPRLDPIFEESGRLGMPVIIHTGDPKAFFEPCDETNERWEELQANPDWCFADRGRFPSWEDLFAAFVRRVARHPNTIFVGAHFGNAPEEPARVARVMRDHPNLWIDTAARIPEIGRRPPEEVRAVFLEFADRILFGTDYGIGPDSLMLGSGSPYVKPTQADVDLFWRGTWRYLETADADIPSPTPIQGRWTLRGINLPCEVLEKIYYRNAERLLGIRLEGAGAIAVRPP